MSEQDLRTAPDGRAMEAGTASSLFADQRGSIFAEYVVLLSVVAMVCVAALILAGIPLVRNFYMQTAIIGLPVP